MLFTRLRKSPGDRNPGFEGLPQSILAFALRSIEGPDKSAERESPSPPEGSTTPYNPKGVEGREPETPSGYHGYHFSSFRPDLLLFTPINKPLSKTSFRSLFTRVLLTF